MDAANPESGSPQPPGPVPAGGAPPNATEQRRALPIVAAAVAAAGAVFGDIGTSPLYAFSQLRAHAGLDGVSDVYGAASLVFWTLTIVVFGKYLTLVMRADNQGEGGAFALLAQVQVFGPAKAVIAAVLTMSAALLYGEGLITPAISVLSAVEGVRVVRPALGPLVVPTTLLLLTALFATQARRTPRWEWGSGLVMVVWFLAIGTIGALQVAQHPQVLTALSPHLAAQFLYGHGLRGTIVALGAAVLCITGSEALFAGMGPFGAKAIRAVWAVLVYPALVLQYLGQAAFLAAGGEVVGDNVFFSVVPESARTPMIVLAVAAAVIASQALVSSAFHLTRQAINLGLLPRLQLLHTSSDDERQVYVPPVNWLLWGGSCLLVLQFGSVDDLASAYGLAAVITMVATSVATGAIARASWGWSGRWAAVVFGGFALIECGFLIANAWKVPDGAWLPVSVAGAVFATTRIWQRGRADMAAALNAVERWSVAELLTIKARLPVLPRAMVFLTPERIVSDRGRTPLVLMKFADRYGALPRHVTLFSVVIEADQPFWRGERFDVRHFGDNVTAVCMHVGYMENPNTRAALVHLRELREVKVQATRWTIVMGRDEVIVPDRGLTSIVDQVFSLLASMAVQADVWFGIDSDTGISKEVIPYTFDSRGRMYVAIHKPALDDLPPPKPPVVHETPPEEPSDTVLEDTSMSDIPRVTGTEEVPK